MRKFDRIYDRIYRIVSTVNFVLHTALAAFIVSVGFLPFRNNENFYEAFNGYFGDFLGFSHPLLIMLLMITAGVCAFLGIKHPIFALLPSVLIYVFFLIVTLNYSLEVAFFNLMSYFGGTKTSEYQTGFYLIGNAYGFVYYSRAFTVYAFVTMFIRSMRTGSDV